MATSSLTRNADFMKLWIGETVSLVGSAITMLALPLTALNLLHATPLDMGFLLACSAGAAALAGFFTGALADRLSRRVLMLASNIGLALTVAAIPILFLLGALSLTLLFVAALVSGILNSLFSAAYQGYVPDLVGKDALVAANSRLEGSRVLATLIGALLSGILIAVLSAPVALFIDAGSFLFAAVSLALIRQRPMVRATEPRAGLLSEIAVGLRYVFAQPILRSILLLAAMFNLFAPMLNGQIVLYLSHTLRLSPIYIGAGFALAGLGGVSMAMLAPRIIAWLGLGRTVTVAAFIVAGGWALVPVASGTFTAILTILASGAVIGTMGDVLINISAGSLRQEITPSELQGRVGASISIIVAGLQPIGAIIGGVIAQAYGVRWALVIFAGGFLLTFLLVLLSPIRRTPSKQVAEGVSIQVAS